MKVTVELTSAEYAGICAYLKEDSEDGKVSHEEIRRYVQNIVTSVINSPQEAVSMYIQRQFD